MRNFILLLVSIVFFTGCASFSNYQTAQVLPEDERQFGVGLTFTNISPEEGVEVDYEDITYFTPELMFRTGVARNFDFGAKIYSSFPVVGIVIDGKYQFVDRRAFDMAFDLGVGYTGVEIDDEGLTYLDFYPALLMTFNFSDAFSATLVPKVIVRRISSDAGDDTESIPGATLTLSLGKRTRIMPEVGYFKGEDRLGQEIEFTHWGIGIQF